MIFSKDSSWFHKVSKVRINDTSDYIVTRSKPHKDGVIITLQGISDRNQSELLCGQSIAVPAEIFQSEPDERPFLVEIEQFKVIDQALGELGFVNGFSTNGIQDLLIVKSTMNEYEIPFVDAFVSKIDSENKILYVDLPEGILSINESEDQEPQSGTKGK